jgi:hypothetical protein
VERFGSENNLSPSEGCSRGGSKWRKQVVETKFHIEATGDCLLERRCSCSLLARNIIYLILCPNRSSSLLDGASRRYDKKNHTVWLSLAFDIVTVRLSLNFIIR